MPDKPAQDKPPADSFWKKHGKKIKILIAVAFIIPLIYNARDWIDQIQRRQQNNDMPSPAGTLPEKGVQPDTSQQPDTNSTKPQDSTPPSSKSDQGPGQKTSPPNKSKSSGKKKSPPVSSYHVYVQPIDRGDEIIVLKGHLLINDPLNPAEEFNGKLTLDVKKIENNQARLCLSLPDLTENPTCWNVLPEYRRMFLYNREQYYLEVLDIADEYVFIMISKEKRWKKIEGQRIYLNDPFKPADNLGEQYSITLTKILYDSEKRERLANIYIATPNLTGYECINLKSGARIRFPLLGHNYFLDLHYIGTEYVTITITKDKVGAN